MERRGDSERNKGMNVKNSGGTFIYWIWVRSRVVDKTPLSLILSSGLFDFLKTRKRDPSDEKGDLLEEKTSR